ncbi:MAG TPA: sugar transferase, partial [Pseudonocardia sp.]
MDPGSERLARRAIDLVVATLGLLLMALPMVLIGLAIRLTSTGPALFQQRRIGYGGRSFTMYKFRTMRT